MTFEEKAKAMYNSYWHRCIKLSIAPSLTFDEFKKSHELNIRRLLELEGE